MNAYDAVLFISFGGPEKMDDVMPFLEIVTKGRGIPRERLLGVAHHYEQLGGASPINAITKQQAAALSLQLKQNGCTLPVYIGQRNWNPFIEETLRRMMADGIRRAVGFITAAHRTEASLERYVNAVAEARSRIGPSAPEIDYVDPWFDHPLFIEAIAQRVRETLNRAKAESASTENLFDAPWYFIAHSIPCSMAKESTYVPELKRTAALVCQALSKKDWRMAYSSRSGNPRDPWLVPDVNEAIRDEAARGAKDILFITIGFIADHIEVLFDQDVEARDTAAQAGIRFHRSATVGDHPTFVRMMADVVQRRLRAASSIEQTQSKSSREQDGRAQACVGRASPTCYCFPESVSPPCLAASPSAVSSTSSGS